MADIRYPEKIKETIRITTSGQLAGGKQPQAPGDPRRQTGGKNLADQGSKDLKLYHTYCLVGGMPEVLQKWADTGLLSAILPDDIGRNAKINYGVPGICLAASIQKPEEP